MSDAKTGSKPHRPAKKVGKDLKQYLGDGLDFLIERGMVEGDLLPAVAALTATARDGESVRVDFAPKPLQRSAPSRKAKNLSAAQRAAIRRRRDDLGITDLYGRDISDEALGIDVWPLPEDLENPLTSDEASSIITALSNYGGPR